MKSDSSQSTMHALALLPERERAHAAKLIQQNVAARTQNQAAEDVTAAILLARSGGPLQPPAGALLSVMDQISKRDRRAVWVERSIDLLRWSGWGVAAALAVWMSLHSVDKAASSKVAIESRPSPQVPSKPTVNQPPAVHDNQTGQQIAQLRKEVAALKAELQDLKQPTSGKKSITVMQFRQPGVPTSAANGSLNGKMLVSLLSSSLQPYLANSARGSTTGPEIVIEQGYGAFSADTLPEGYYFRHRRFPVDEWEQLGLSRDDSGRFYDPYGNLIWSEDPRQPGTYVSAEPGPGDDLTRFSPGTVSVAARNPPPPQAANQRPEVMAVVDPASKTGSVIVSNADKVASAQQGKVPVLWIGKPTLGGPTKWIPAGVLATATSGSDLAPAANSPVVGANIPSVVALDEQATDALLDGPTTIAIGYEMLGYTTGSEANQVTGLGDVLLGTVPQSATYLTQPP